MICRKHPRYQVKKRPRVACEACWILWFEMVQNTSYQCKFCSFQPTSQEDYCDTHKACKDLVLTTRERILVNK